jgi:hypothetical protein
VILDLPEQKELVGDLLQVSSDDMRHLTDRELLLLLNYRLLSLEGRFKPVEQWVDASRAQLALVKWGWVAALGAVTVVVAAHAAHMM